MKTIAIIGGGVAGLALANAMLKYSNEWKVTVFEQAKQIRTKLGAGIGLQAGQIVLNELGFKEKLQELTVPISNIVVCKPSEEQVINVDLVAQQKKHVIPEGIDVMFRAILRTNLLNMLKDGLPEDVIQLDKKFQQYEVGNDNKVTTYFTDGTSFISDVLVGADGIHSGVQEQMTGHVENNYSGYGAWYGVALLGADSELMKAETKAMQFLVGDKTLVASYPCSKEGHVSFVLTHKMPEPIFEKMELEDAKTKAKEFAQGHEYPKFATLARSTSGKTGQSYSWVTCHATLPSGGQGGNQAIIDAGVLAKLLTKTDFGIEEALNKFYEIRHGPTRTIVENSDKAILLFTSGLENILSRQAPFQFWGENWNLGIEDIINKSEL